MALMEESGYCYDPRMLTHHPYEEDPEDKHPEQPQRILKIYEKIRGKPWQSLAKQEWAFVDLEKQTDASLDGRMQQVAVREAVREEVTLIHSEQHWERVRRMACRFPLLSPIRQLSSLASSLPGCSDSRYQGILQQIIPLSLARLGSLR